MRTLVGVVAAGIAGALIISLPKSVDQGSRPGEWRDRFEVDKAALVHVGRNRFFVLDPGHQSVLVHGETRLVITALDATEVVDGVRTRVVEERESENERLVEVSRNFFALDPRDSSVYYFGEDVDIYRNGTIASHEGAWRSGVNGARFGLFIPGRPTRGLRYYQEVAPKVAMDRVEVISVTDSVTVPAGAYGGCLRLRETTQLEPFVTDAKRYCPGVGIVQDGDLKLIRAPLPGRPR
jgi:hypothetical protein